MKVCIGYKCDIGTTKKVNQDAILIKCANTIKGKVCMLAVCDGMGGLSQGELASTTVILELSKWFERYLPQIIVKDTYENEIKESILKILNSVNIRIKEYGENKDIKLGTTLSLLLVINNVYYIYNIGDSRTYIINESVNQITKDQSYVQREVDLGRLTTEQARCHPKRNILLQCIGVSENIEIDSYTGNVKEGTAFLLGSDGFCHEIKNGEMLEIFAVNEFIDDDMLTTKCSDIVEKIKLRGEKDNISVIAAKFI